MRKNSTLLDRSEGLPVKGALLLIGLAAWSAQAQTGDESPVPAGKSGETATEASTTQLEAVVVTGEKVGRTLGETTSSVNVITNKQLRDYGDESVFDALSRTGNATSAQNGTFSLRGVSNLSAEGFTNGQSAQPVISTYLDGVSVDTAGQSANLLDSYDVERVEILRGSQSTNQGRNALGGAIVITTREPTDFWDLNGKFRAAGFGEREFAVAGGGPLGGGFAFRLAGDYTVNNGFITNTTLDDGNWNQQRDTLWRGKLAWTPSYLPGFSVLLTSGRAARNGGGNQLNEEFDAAGDSTHRQATNNVETDQSTSANPSSVRIKYQIAPKLEFTAITGYIQSRQDIVQDYDRSAADNGTLATDQRNRNFSQELRFNLNKWHGLTGVFGLYGGRFAQKNASDIRNIPLVLGDVLPIPLPIGDLLTVRLDIDGRIETASNNLAAFSEFDYAVTPKLTFTAGVRYDNEKNTTFSSSQLTRADLNIAGVPLPISLVPVLAPVIGSNPGQTASDRFHALLPKFGVRYALTEQLNLFATYTEAYRAGGADVIINTGAINQFDPEFTRTYDVGFRSSLFKDLWATRLNLYRTDWRDQQVQTLSPDGNSFFTQNAAKSRLYGAELENTFKLTRRWSAYASVGYSNSQFKDYVTANGDFGGNEFTYAPHVTGSIGTSYHSAIGLFATASLSHTDPYFLMPNNESRSRSDGYELLDLRLGYENSTFSINFFARNLLDQDYAYYRFHLDGGIGQQPGRQIGYGEPRVFGVQVDIHPL